jgi:hypothetical protein
MEEDFINEDYDLLDTSQGYHYNKEKRVYELSMYSYSVTINEEYTDFDTCFHRINELLKQGFKYNQSSVTTVIGRILTISGAKGKLTRVKNSYSKIDYDN